MDDEVEEEFDLDLNDKVAPFLEGQTSKDRADVSPVKIVKNPDGSLQRAAMTQSALAKERRELSQQEQRAAAEVGLIHPSILSPTKFQCYTSVYISTMLTCVRKFGESKQESKQNKTKHWLISISCFKQTEYFCL